MHHASGSGWQITTDTSGPMMIALYVRDAAALNGVGRPVLSHTAPKIRSADHTHLTAEVGGLSALKTEWEAWWDQLLKAHPQTVPELSPPDFEAFGNSPALQRVLQAHFGSALTWARERRSEYAELEGERVASGTDQLLAEMVDDRLMEIGRDSRDFRLTIIELPLDEQRAWYLEPDKIIMSQELMGQPELFRSYVQPVLEILV
ncbi:hypothetical protein [Pseudarthrobacter sp. lyk4-40-TYG-27]|uniref:hypothetical protein n=1 Tax=Pseudarthrobacter sp. lyk4-40-TYG-27 TaxID=3040305 RepID=UPI00255762E8|nr:hypothetical protein [Pseudarthrobacter sp. lyk4-40-TYG-27]